VARIRGATVSGVERRGKHQLLALETGDTVVVHFRMTGDWLVDEAAKSLPDYARVVIELDEWHARLAHRSAGAVHGNGTPCGRRRRCRTVGPDAADRTVTGRGPWSRRSQKRRVAIKVALLDQRVLAGVGNIYAAEALWLARIDPRAVASSLSNARQRRLLDAIRAVLDKAQRGRRSLS
jgi:formamidopyrimidine-DNA glycosylase